MARQSSHASRLDVGITQVVQIESSALRDAIAAADFIRRPEYDGSLLKHRFLFALDSNTSAGNGLLESMLSGACVLLIESRFKFRSWYYDNLVPWMTHIPVKFDLSDLEERLSWAFNHPDECVQIASRSHELAQGMSFASESQHSVRRMQELLR
jgi:hypothetical protein